MVSEKTVISNIRATIKSKGFKQCAIAERAGFNQRAFSDMLNGRKIMKAVDMISIANALGVTPNEICGISTGQKSA